MKKINEIPKFTKKDRVYQEIGKNTSQKTADNMNKNEDRSGLRGFILALIFAISGIIFLGLGIAGKINISAEILGSKITLVDCCPGALLIVVSIITYIFSRPKVKSE